MHTFGPNRLPRMYSLTVDASQSGRTDSTQLIGCVLYVCVGLGNILSCCTCSSLTQEGLSLATCGFLGSNLSGLLGMLANACESLRLEVSNDTTDLMALSKSHVLES